MLTRQDYLELSEKSLAQAGYGKGFATALQQVTLKTADDCYYDAIYQSAGSLHTWRSKTARLYAPSRLFGAMT
jgi:hypothetical protein